MTTQTTLKFPKGQDWVRQVCDWAVKQPEDSYAHRAYCGNCNEQNYFYVKKGIRVKRGMFECERCGCDI